MSETFSLRPATDADYPWLQRLLPQLQSGDPIPTEEQYRATYRGRFSLFGPIDGDPVGGTVLDALDDTGYVRVVVIDEPHRGQGAGAALMGAIAAKLRASGCTRWCLNVKVDNEPALRLYERFGMRRAYESHALRLAWDRVSALPETHEIIVARELVPSDDAAIEAAWELPRGQLAQFRQMKGQRVLGLFDEADPSRSKLGVARANPGHPGVFPFRVGRVEYARTLIEAARPLFDQRAPLGVVVEDDAALAALLLSLGAERKMHLAHMRGSIPLLP
ncbi:MAG: GNAT family N-acetyltransferase [Polyangiales bacterium]